VTGDCSRLSNVACAFAGTSTSSFIVVNVTANVDRDCDSLPYATCDPAASSCCGANTCQLAPPSTTYYMCQP
jgi:hypothetical protein